MNSCSQQLITTLEIWKSAQYQKAFVFMYYAARSLPHVHEQFFC